jgi:hypothetical protein
VTGWNGGTDALHLGSELSGSDHWLSGCGRDVLSAASGSIRNLTGIVAKTRCHRTAIDPLVAAWRKYVIPEVTAGIFWLKNRDPEHCRDVQRLQDDVGHYLISEQTSHGGRMDRAAHQAHRSQERYPCSTRDAE